VYKQSTQISNINNNSWKTVTINIPDAGFTSRQTNDMDFRIYNGGNNDITVRFVRVVKTINPALVGIKENIDELKNNLKLFPNPTKDILNFDSDVTLSEITITDIYGKQILKQNVNVNFIDVSKLTNGLYFISFKLDKSSLTATKKFIKK
jgi:hypothetical protein